MTSDGVHVTTDVYVMTNNMHMTSDDVHVTSDGSRGGNLRQTATRIAAQVIYSKQPNLGLTQESLRMVTARVLFVLSGSFTS